MNEQKENKMTTWSILIIIMVALLASLASLLFLVVIPAVNKINHVTEGIGNTAGEVIGTGVGVIMGQDDLVEGFDEGHDIGLSAEDTVVETRKKVEDLGSGQLEVLTANIAIRNVQTQGEDMITGAYYAALYEYRGNIVFTVDLNEVKLDYKDDDVTVTIPEPTARIIIDERQTVPVATYQSVVGMLITTPVDGIESTLNSRAELMEKSAQELEEYDDLLKMAEDEALKQIKTLAESVILDGEVTVKMK